MKKLLLTLLLLISTSAYAVDPDITPVTTINCAMPIEREDGTALALDEIAEVRFYSGTATGSYTLPMQPNNVCQKVIDNTALADGDYFYVFTVVDTDSRESKYSAEKVHTVKRVKPPAAGTWLEDS